MIDEEMAAVLRQKTEAERLAIAFGMIRSARAMIVNHLRSQHPDWDEAHLPFGHIHDLCSAFPPPDFYVGENRRGKRSSMPASSTSSIAPPAT